MTIGSEPTADPTLAHLRECLERELDAISGGRLGEATTPEPFGEGHSGFTYATTITDGAGTRDLVLRLSPPGARISGPADVGRQGRIMRSLAASGVPVPAVIACSSEPAIDGRSYMLVERVAGVDHAEALAVTSAAAVAEAALGVCRALAAVVPGREAFGDAPTSVPTAELSRWDDLLGRCSPAVEASGRRLGSALLAAAPERREASIFHGDFHYGNLLFGRDSSDVVAVLDWELAGTGAAAWDLGSLIVATLRRRYEPREPNSMGGPDVSPAWLAAAYGVDAEEGAWFAAAACLKYTAIIGFNLELHRGGKREDPEYARLLETLDGLPRDGLALLRDGLPERVERG
ncbi:MAG TPA: phosphotransferase family protein [Solirubrobacterales bacterium]|nr:phosphotransferase family protein [Solirubrobacterales bacterium]